MLSKHETDYIPPRSRHLNIQVKHSKPFLLLIISFLVMYLWHHGNKWAARCTKAPAYAGFGKGSHHFSCIYGTTVTDHEQIFDYFHLRSRVLKG